MSVIIETSIGDITVDLYTDERPRCCMNFLKLCKIKYYNFSLFHTVQENLVAQTGDPTATGRGGESIFTRLYGEQARFFDMEMSPRIKHTKKGLMSMVNNGSGVHGSQFFFTLADNLDYLDGKHTVFGEVAEGFDTLEKFNNTFCGEDNRPHQDIRIYHTIILDDPFDDPDALDIPANSPGPTEEMLNSDHIPCDANIDEDGDKTEQELAELAAKKEAQANAQILEMVGDLPDAEVAPPENVLFVCKLNPVTTSEDLEIIFSRFGPVVSCEVIKDSKTGESLQYAFIEFENPQHCENAYFKMDNVLIDDRRIHVDFSQSVSKLKWKGKGKGVEILPTGDAPVYVLKSQQRQNDGYDLVYEHDDKHTIIDRKGERRKEKSQKSLDDRKAGQNRKHYKSRSRSPMRSDRDRQTRRSEHSVRKMRDTRDDDSKRRQHGHARKDRSSEKGKAQYRQEKQFKRDGSGSSGDDMERKKRTENRGDERDDKERRQRLDDYETNSEYKRQRKHHSEDDINSSSDDNHKNMTKKKRKKQKQGKYKSQEGSTDESEVVRNSRYEMTKRETDSSTLTKMSKKKKKKHKSKQQYSSSEDNRRGFTA